MRSLRLSNTFIDELHALLAAGISDYGAELVGKKYNKIYDVINDVLLPFPEGKRMNPELSVHAFPVSSTPFVVFYEFDDVEVRILSIWPSKSDIRQFDVRRIQW